MIALQSVQDSSDRIEVVPIDALGESHALSDAATKMFGRFYGLRSVTRHADDLTSMLGPVLGAALDQLEDGGKAAGQLVYCKTQTHNTLTDRNWLRANRPSAGSWPARCACLAGCGHRLAGIAVGRRPAC